MMTLLVCLLAMLAASSAAAFDVTSCGQSVPAGEQGLLLNDLDCSSEASLSMGITLGRSSSLDLQGYSVVAAPNGVAIYCEFGESKTRFTPNGPISIAPMGSCEIVSTGATAQISGTHGIVSERHLTVQNVSVTTSSSGIGVDIRSGRLVASDVTVTAGGHFGIAGRRLDLQNVSVSGSQIFGIYGGFGGIRGANVTSSNNLGGGVYGKLTIVGLTCQNNGGPGVQGVRPRLTDSLLTGNIHNGYPLDLWTVRSPKLENTVCGTSGKMAMDPPYETWGVCSND